MIGTRGVVTSVVVFTRRNKCVIARLKVMPETRLEVAIPAFALASAVNLIRRRKLVLLINVWLVVPWGNGFVITEISCGRCLT